MFSSEEYNMNTAIHVTAHSKLKGDACHDAALTSCDIALLRNLASQLCPSSAHKNMCSNELITVALQKEAISPCAFQKQFHLSYRKITLQKNKVALFFFSVAQPVKQKFTPKLKHDILYLPSGFPFPVFPSKFLFFLYNSVPCFTKICLLSFVNKGQSQCVSGLHAKSPESKPDNAVCLSLINLTCAMAHTYRPHPKNW